VQRRQRQPIRLLVKNQLHAANQATIDRFKPRAFFERTVTDLRLTRRATPRHCEKARFCRHEIWRKPTSRPKPTAWSDRSQIS